jgi:uncharacterized protein (DUF427 family)
MSLTIPPGPLSGSPPEEVNYRIDGPAHRLFAHPFPRRVRAEVDGVTVLDTERGRLLHETGLGPVLYAPVEDVRQDLLEPTDHHTHCPFKGDASYWSVRVGDRVAENAVWGYPEPKPEAPWLAGWQAFYFDRVDAWYDEDERVFGHLRDPYHRVDVRRTSRSVRVTSKDGQLLAETDRALLLSETGLPNRFYLPVDDVRTDLLTASDTHTHCPYKGDASYRSLGGAEPVADVVWEYPEPFAEAAQVRGHLSFYPEKVVIDVK